MPIRAPSPRRCAICSCAGWTSAWRSDGSARRLYRKTGNQEPYVYGSLRRGGNTAIVPSPFQPEVDLQGEKSDYSLVEKVDTARAWQVFLVQHPTGIFSDDARQRLRLAEAEPTAPEQRPGTAIRVPSANDEQEAACRSEEDRLRSLRAQGASAIDELKTLEQNLTCERLRPLVIAALDRANPVPNVDTPEQVRSAQGQLIRLGCFTGTADGRLDAATIAALLLYLNKQGIKPSGDVHITDDLIAELTKQTARVCPLVCPPGKVADRDQCIDATRANRSRVPVKKVPPSAAVAAIRLAGRRSRPRRSPIRSRRGLPSRSRAAARASASHPVSAFDAQRRSGAYLTPSSLEVLIQPLPAFEIVVLQFRATRWRSASAAWRSGSRT